MIWPGLWRKDARDKLSEYLDRLPELAPVIRESLRTVVLFTAAIDGDRRIRERVEGALALHYREHDGPASALLAPDIRYRPRKEAEPPIRVRVHCADDIKSLPGELVA